MEFIYGALCGAGILAIGICLSMTYEPYGRNTEYRIELGLDVEEEYDEET